MAKIEDKLKELWNNESVRDVGIITGVTLVEYIAEKILFREMAPKYQPLARIVVNGSSNGVSYYLGKSQGEKINQNKNGQP